MKTSWPGMDPDDSFESMARQYWSSWGQLMRGGGAPTGGAMPDWQDALNWWGKLAQQGGSPDVHSAVERFNAQARDWYGQMQEVAARFAGSHAPAAEVVAAWKQAMGAYGDNPFPEMFRAMQGKGAQGLEQWTEAAAPWLDAWRRESRTLLGMPAFGLGREHQERIQALAQAQLDYQQQEAAYNALMLKAAQQAYALFEKKLSERDAPGRQLTTARALFDLWIEAAEEAYAEMALSTEFREAYGARVNAQMRLRQAVQGEVEQMSATFGMPTRSDIDAAFRKIADLERALRKLRDEVANAQPDRRRPTPTSGATADSAGPRTSAGAAAPPTATAARNAATARKSAKTTATKTTAKKATAKGKPR
jgi:class III poly(R)-hydroxyalkanoic acid synthase PhaE subunit